MLKRYSSSVELLPHDVVELILERLTVERLLRFKSVSKNWKSTIESRRFHERQFIRRKQSRDLDVLYVAVGKSEDDNGDDDYYYWGMTMSIVLGSSIISTVRFPTIATSACNGTCDGLVCMSGAFTPNFLVNPATRWHRHFPQSNVQLRISDSYSKKIPNIPCSHLGLGRDKVKGTYKPVFLYNSSEFGLDNVTTCEVFDFSTNAWRYVLPASPYRIRCYYKPVYFDGSLHWFTECEDHTKVLSFDLHTETFQVIFKTPFPHVRDSRDVFLCILDNRLCVSERSWPNKVQVIWSFDSSGTWKKICSMDLTKIFSWLEKFQLDCALSPVAIVDKNKLLLHGRHYMQPILIYDLVTKSFDLLFTPATHGGCAYYYQSLFSA